jgi:hypothetical protein
MQVAFNDSLEVAGSARASVYLDGLLAWRSRSLDNSWNNFCSVPCVGASTLTLAVDFFDCDAKAVFIDPRLVFAPSPRGQFLVVVPVQEGPVEGSGVRPMKLVSLHAQTRGAGPMPAGTAWFDAVLVSASQSLSPFLDRETVFVFGFVLCVADRIVVGSTPSWLSPGLNILERRLCCVPSLIAQYLEDGMLYGASAVALRCKLQGASLSFTYLAFPLRSPPPRSPPRSPPGPPSPPPPHPPLLASLR